MSNDNSISPYEVRRRFFDLMMGELHGPKGGPEELLEELYVRDRYVLGVLAPRGQSVLPDEEDEIAVSGGDGEDGQAESSAPQAPSQLQSAFGMTFVVAEDAVSLEVNVRWGHYERTSAEELGIEKERPTILWQRKQKEYTSDPIALKPGRMPRWHVDPLEPDIYVDGLFRERNGEWVITLFLVNETEMPATEKDSAYLFQAEMSVSAPDGTAIFRKRPLPANSMMDAEDHNMRMLYRNRVEFSVGHGISTIAELARGEVDKAVKISTCAVPTYEMPKTTPPTIDEIPALNGLVLDMSELSEIPDGGFTDALLPLVDAYDAWIDELRGLRQDPELRDFEIQTQQTIQVCEKNSARIRASIHVLDDDLSAAEAFRFANKAMWQQRVRAIYTENKRRGENKKLEEVDIPKNRTWYPFQLAFVLLNLASLANPVHAERNHPTNAIADVLWFPTGGGKTEAYLGLTAFTIAIRRLQGKQGDFDGSGGVAVLMRYTLRLLTLQQFQRAATLICACENIRLDAVKKGDGKWGEEPIRIGLWVGGKSTPNWNKDSDEIVKRFRSTSSFRATSISAGGSPHQLTNCPWCGEELNPARDIVVETYKHGRCRTLVYCPSNQCRFNKVNSNKEGLPVIVVDEEVYRRLPALVIATVDKLAQLPWKGEVQMLFGRVNGKCPRHGYRSPEIEDANSHPAEKVSGLPAVETEACGALRPPDLIIQDELHLISGPLGTMVGLYETAIDSLCEWKLNGQTVRPKVIASSATIRRAPLQVKNLYLRQTNIFPPSGINLEDNFFARQRNPDEENPGRLYVGIMAPGQKAKVMSARVYTAALSAAKFLYDDPEIGKLADPYMTLIGYCNSIRELGGQLRLLDDTIPTRLKKMDRRGLGKRYLHYTNLAELTSRIGATDIPNILDRLNAEWDPDKVAKEKKRTSKIGKSDLRNVPLDVLLATNMISVGVDVPRLGLMTVTGQPKYTSEYIQATSRIGRRHPGIVLTLFNWVRPRDVSHYEKFIHYHETLYQQVEPLSVTPFSPRALDRGLSGILVGMIRQWNQELNPNDRAAVLKRDNPNTQLIVQSIQSRAEMVTDDPQIRTLIEAELKTRLDFWLAKALKLKNAGSHLGYKEKKDGRTLGLLQYPGLKWEKYTCLNSLRDVEAPVNLILHTNLGTPLQTEADEHIDTNSEVEHD